MGKSKKLGGICTHRRQHFKVNLHPLASYLEIAFKDAKLTKVDLLCGVACLEKNYLQRRQAHKGGFTLGRSVKSFPQKSFINMLYPNYNHGFIIPHQKSKYHGQQIYPKNF